MVVSLRLSALGWQCTPYCTEYCPVASACKIIGIRPHGAVYMEYLAAQVSTHDLTPSEVLVSRQREMQSYVSRKLRPR